MDPIIVDLQRKGFDGLITDLQKTGQAFVALDVAMEQAQKRLFELPKGSAEFKKIEAEVKAIEAAMKAAATSTGKLTQELTKTTNELGQIKQAMNAAEAASGKNTETFKNLEAQYEATRKKGEEIKNTLKGIRSELSDTHGVDIAVRGISTLVSGYGILQGVSALLGKENKGLQESLVKLNAIMLIGNSIQQISVELNKSDSIFTGIAAAAKRTYAFATAGATIATKAFRAALVSTGIGAVIVAVTTLIANFDSLTKSGGFLSDVLNAIGTVIKKSIQGYKDLSDAIGLTNFAANEAAEDEKKRQDEATEDLKIKGDQRVALLKAQGKETLKIELDNDIAIFKAKEKKFRSEQSSLSELVRKERIKELDQLSADIKVKEAQIAKSTLDQAKKTVEESVKEEIRFLKASGKEREALIFAIEQSETNIRLASTRLQSKKALNDKLEAVQALNKFDDDVAKKQAEERKKRDAAAKKAKDALEKLQDEVYKMTIADAEKTQKDLAAFQKIREDEKDRLIAEDKERSRLKLVASQEDLAEQEGIWERERKKRKEQSDLIKQDLEDRKEAERAVMSEIVSIIEGAYSITSSIISINAQREIANLEDKKNKGLITEKELQKETAKIKNEAAEKQHKADVAFAFAKVPLIVLEAFSSVIGVPIVGPILAPIAAAVAGAFALAQAALVAATPVPKFKEGGSVAQKLGLIEGKPHSQGGVPIEVEGKEYVMPTEPTKKHLPALEAMRKGTFDKLFIPTNLAMNADLFSRIPNPSTLPNPVRTHGNDNSAIESKLKTIADELWYLRYETKLGNKDRRSGTDKVVKNLSTKQSGYQ